MGGLDVWANELYRHTQPSAATFTRVVRDRILSDGAWFARMPLWHRWRLARQGTYSWRYQRRCIAFYKETTR